MSLDIMPLELMQIMFRQLTQREQTSVRCTCKYFSGAVGTTKLFVSSATRDMMRPCVVCGKRIRSVVNHGRTPVFVHEFPCGCRCHPMCFDPAKPIECNVLHTTSHAFDRKRQRAKKKAGVGQ